MKLIHRLFLAFCAVLVLVIGASAQYTGISATSTPGLNVRRALTTDQSVLFPPAQDFRILPGDLLRVAVYGVAPEFTAAERVNLDGNIRLNLIGVVQVAGLSLKEAEIMLSHLAEQRQIFHDAQITVEVTDAPNHVVTLVGEMKGVLAVVGNRRLLDVLSAGGGLPTTASTIIQINRVGMAEPILVDLGNDPAQSLAANIPIFSGDVITVGRVGVFYVVGAVARVGITPLNGALPTTVLQAISASGGTTASAKKDDARLVRTVGSTRTVIPLHLRDIERGRAPDPVLQSDDILLVPNSAIRDLLRLSTVTSSLAIALSLATLLR